MSDPLQIFKEWFSEALKSEPEPTAMTLATVHADGGPNARMVLLKHVDERGFVFFSHETSQKGAEMQRNNHVALVFHWHSLHRSVRVRGIVVALPDDESDEYWLTRARSAQISALATRQSQVMASRAVLTDRVAAIEAAYPEGSPIPRPVTWHGFVVMPTSIEFWTSAGVSRLHERQLFTRSDVSDSHWTSVLLEP
jgi:pyridoxamine 5'-phosphate oxidase